jgi:Protein of unknown function (DUF2490)
MLRYLLIYGLMLNALHRCAAQKTVTKQQLYWVRYYQQWTLHPNWVWHTELDNRRFFQPHRQHQFVIHSRLHYRPSGKSDIALGLSYSRQSPHDPWTVNRLVVPEWRPVLEFNQNTMLYTRLGLQHRWRTDARFFRRTYGSTLINGFDFNWRFRYRVQASFLLNPNQLQRPAVLKISNELMVNAGRRIQVNQFDQNRIYIGIEYSCSPAISIELGYLRWYQQRATGDAFFERDIVRTTVYHRTGRH